MTVKVNGQTRDDIDIMIGGKLELTSEHKTSSSLSVRIPAEASLEECDYLEIIDGGETLFSGTILGVEQENLGYGDLSFKILNLSISSPCDFVANVFVDMAFPSGANVQQILLGNHPDDDWWDVSQGSYDGIFTARIVPEGITRGHIDDFRNFVVESAAKFWGTYVSDALDEICSACGAWWEITPERVFSMRYTDNHPPAPLILDETAEAADLSASHDAYTLYSAVRVVGGQGPGGVLNAQIYRSGEHNYAYGPAELVDESTIRLKYPLHSMAPNWQHGTGRTLVQLISTFGGAQYQVYNVGYKGIHDDNSSYQALTTSGGDTIELKEGATPFIALPESERGVGTIYFSYIPLVDIYARLIDPELADEIKEQRGGTGVIEYLYEDDTINSFNDAMQAAAGFLQSNGRRAQSVEFTTLTPGFSPGQLLRCNVPYYGVVGEYIVGSVSAELIEHNGTDAIWQYTISASTVDYRDANIKLFARTKKMTITIGTDSPPIDGRVFLSEVAVKSTVTINVYGTPTWEYHDGQALTWQSWAEQYANWTEWQSSEMIHEEEYMGYYLTDNGKARLASILAGGDADISLVGNLYLLDSGGLMESEHFSPSNTPYAQGDTVYSTYYIGETQAQDHITQLRIMYTGSDGQMIEVQRIPVDIDKSPDSPMGSYALTVTKIDTVI